MEILKLDSLVESSSAKYVRAPIENTNGLVRLLCLELGQAVPLHNHPDGDEVFYVLSGGAEFTVGKEIAQMSAGSFVRAVAGIYHSWKNGSERLILISILTPPSSHKLADQATKMEFV